jgi:type IV fimbrial biogenesis protein FimT
MLKTRSTQAGVSLIELAVAVTIMAVLMASGLPSFSNWIQSGKIRTTAESIQNGLQLARAQAVARNALVSFHLTSSATAACALSSSGSNWVVSLDDPTGACDAAASDETAPRLIQMRTAAEGASNVEVDAGSAGTPVTTITFNGMGRVTPLPAAAITIALTNSVGGACAAAGPMRCLNVTVSTAGQIRMCDPALPATDARGC